MSETNKNQLFRFDSVGNSLPLILSTAITLVMIVFLYLQGRIWWCKFRDLTPYYNDGWSQHTSQHFFDPYSFTHILHGVIIFWIAYLIFSRLSIAWRFFIAVLGEAAWEGLENTNFIIDKYRENTASLDYTGDSIFNSVGDVFACALGFWIALKLGWWRSLALFILTEIILIIWIHDSLIINIILLIYPLDSLKEWQTGKVQ